MTADTKLTRRVRDLQHLLSSAEVTTPPDDPAPASAGSGVTMPPSQPIIVLEGLDGCGKTTLCGLLAQTLGAAAMSSSAGELAAVRATCDALHGPSGLSRQLYYAYAVSLVSRRACEHAQHAPVIIDRYWASTLVYAHAQDPDALWLDELAAKLTPATLTVYLDLDASQRRARLIRRSPQIADADATSLRLDAALRERFLELLPCLPTTGELLLLDASLPADHLCATILRALAREPRVDEHPLR